MRLEHWYHIFADGDWKHIAAEHFERMKHAGLLDAMAGNIYIGIVGSRSNINSCLQWLKKESGLPKNSEGVAWYFASCRFEGWENVTLEALRRQARDFSHIPHVAFYAHTKGAAFPGSFQDRWRASMDEMVIGEWERIVSMLSSGAYDIAGCFFTEEHFYGPDVPVFAGVHGVSSVRALLERNADAELHWSTEVDEPQPIGHRYHYSGNFWWSTFDWIRQLPSVPTDTRWQSEMWVATGNPRAIDLRSGSPFVVCREAQ